MELEKLRIFLAVAECRSFSLGAKKLYISHSTTSRAIAALEEELGVELLRQAGSAAERVRQMGKKTDGSE